ncbi:MAG: DUF4974 domain-containing protein [Chitinophagaceae bacterium]
MNYSGLLEKFAGGTATDEEKALFNQWLQTLSADECREVLDAYATMLAGREVNEPYRQDGWDQLLEKIKNEEAVKAPVRNIVTGRIMAWAAAILLLLAAGAFFLFRGVEKGEGREVVKTGQPADILPGKDGAILTLADGSRMVLDSLGNGVVTTQGGITVSLKNGQLIYTHDSVPVIAGEVLYNTMTTPKGRQYQLVLPDGSKVWLNAASSITYPVAFTGDRKVMVTGEAYFEVAQLTGAGNKPARFIVNVDDRATVEVLGTHFNINAYRDEAAMHTTLLEGKVSIDHTGNDALEPVILKPGQQARLVSGKAIKVLNDVDTDEVMAWKNGLFHFEDADIKTVMRQLARWYDLEVEFEGALPKGGFTGELGRTLTLSQVLKILSGTRVKYRIEEGNRIVILG